MTNYLLKFRHGASGIGRTDYWYPHLGGPAVAHVTTEAEAYHWVVSGHDADALRIWEQNAMSLGEYQLYSRESDEDEWMLVDSRARSS